MLGQNNNSTNILELMLIVKTSYHMKALYSRLKLKIYLNIMVDFSINICYLTLINFIILIYHHITTICSFVVTFLTTYRSEVAVFCNYEIDSHDRFYEIILFGYIVTLSSS